MKAFLFLFCIAISISSCSYKNPKTKSKSGNTFIFDFNDTLISDAVLLETIKVSANYDKNKIEKINNVIQERKKQEGGDKVVIYLVLDKIHSILGHRIKKKDFDKAKSNLLEKITPEIKDSIEKIKKSNGKVYIVGGEYSTCGIITEIAKKIKIDSNNIYSGLDGFDKNDQLTFDKKKIGFSHCKSGKKIINTFTKSDAIKYLKENGIIKGKIIHIGDGGNDLEVWESGAVNQFIGFGLNRKVAIVEKNAPIFVRNIKEFNKEIDKFL